MKEYVFLLLAAILAVVTDGQYFYGRPQPRYPFFSRSYYPSQEESYYPSAPSYARRLVYPSHGREVYGGGYHALQDSLENPYEYEPVWLSPHLIRRQRPGYYWNGPPSYRRMARKGNKKNKKGNKKGGGGGGGHSNQGEGGWWYIRDKKGGCISGNWGHPPPNGLEREHYSQGGCGKLGHHSARPQQGNRFQPQKYQPQKYQPQKPSFASYGGGRGGGQGGYGGSGYGRQGGGRYGGGYGRQFGGYGLYGQGRQGGVYSYGLPNRGNWW